MSSDSRLKGRLRRLHGSRVRDTEDTGAARIFLAEDVAEHDQLAALSEPAAEAALSPEPDSPEPAPALERRDHTFPPTHGHGQVTLEAATDWSDPSAVAGLRGRTLPELVFLDIETAGLRQTDPILAVTLARWTGQVFHVKQWATCDTHAERDALAAMRDAAQAPPSGLAPGERVAWLRRTIRRALDQGQPLTSCAHLLTELVALAPHHPTGLSWMARYYRDLGETRCAEALEARISRDLY